MEEALEIKDPPPDIEEYIRNTAGAAYGAGADTVRVIIYHVQRWILIATLDGLCNNELCACHGSEPGGAAESPRRA